MAKGKFQEWLEPEGLLKIEGWARDGLDNDQIAENMGIHRDTLYSWKKAYSDISDALKRGKEVVDRQVENALLKKALGYSYNEDKYAMVKMNQDDYFFKREQYVNEYKYNHPDACQEEIDRIREEFPQYEQVLIERKTKEVSPDTTAQIFWLKNRKPGEWRDKQNIEMSGSVELTADDRREIIETRLKELREQRKKREE